MAGAGLTDLQLANQALGLLGHDPLSSFADQTDTANLVNDTYWTLKRALLLKHIWQWSKTRKRLQPVSGYEQEANEEPWTHAYAVPQDMIGHGPLAILEPDYTERQQSELNQVLPGDTFEIRGDVIYTNLDGAYIVYQFDPPSVDFPSDFADLLTQWLALRWAIGIMGKRDLAMEHRQILYGVGRQQGLLATVIGRARNEDVTPSLPINAEINSIYDSGAGSIRYRLPDDLFGGS